MNSIRTQRANVTSDRVVTSLVVVTSEAVAAQHLSPVSPLSLVLILVIHARDKGLGPTGVTSDSGDTGDKRAGHGGFRPIQASTTDRVVRDAVLIALIFCSRDMAVSSRQPTRAWTGRVQNLPLLQINVLVGQSKPPPAKGILAGAGKEQEPGGSVRSHRNRKSGSTHRIQVARSSATSWNIGVLDFSEFKIPIVPAQHHGDAGFCFSGSKRERNRTGSHPDNFSRQGNLRCPFLANQRDEKDE